jgi:hypothetical protein
MQFSNHPDGGLNAGFIIPVQFLAHKRNLATID